MAPRKKKKPAPRKKAGSRKAPAKTQKARPRKPVTAKKKAVARPKPPAPVAASNDSPIPQQLLQTPEGRERALDALGKWFVGAMLAAVDDLVARETMGVAISTFYDIRAAAGHGRREAAGHFFMIDAVGLEEAHRPIPWEVLARAAPPENLARWEELFEDALTEIA